VLEEIRLLTNLETSTEKTPADRSPLVSRNLKRSLSSRKLRQPPASALCFRLPHHSPFRRSDPGIHRGNVLRIAGASGDPIFSTKTIEAIHVYSMGIPARHQSFVRAFPRKRLCRTAAAHPAQKSSKRWRTSFNSTRVEPVAPKWRNPKWTPMSIITEVFSTESWRGSFPLQSWPRHRPRSEITFKFQI